MRASGTNDELSKFYTDYCATRPSVGMAQQDWTLPEPNVSLYTDEMMANAKEYSDTAMVVITRVGGEGADLPHRYGCCRGRQLGPPCGRLPRLSARRWLLQRLL